MIPVKVADLLFSRLSSQRWTVRRDEGSEAGSPQQDLVVTAPNGKVYLIELKEGEEPTHFATIAQLERSARLLSEQEGGEVVPILLTSQAVRERISELADNSGVLVVEATGSDQEAAESLIHFLQKESK